MKLIYTPEATDSLKVIYKYLDGQNTRAAATIHTEILDAIDRLTDFPEMAPVEQKLKGSPKVYRSLVIRRRWKAVYRIEEQTIYIVDIWDCRQNPKILKRRVIKH